jgi:hypothetical protein
MYRLITHQAAQKEPCLAPYLVPPDYGLGNTRLFIPSAQKVAKTVMKQTIFPGVARIVALSWPQAPGLVIIEIWHPSDGNPVLWLLPLVFV